MLNHEHECAVLLPQSSPPCLASVFSSPHIFLLSSYGAVASRLSDFEFSVNNQLCCPSPPLTPALSLCPALIARCSNMGWKTQPVTLQARWEGATEGVREAARGRMAVETGKQRETVLQTEADWEESPAYLGKPLSQSVHVCVLGPFAI